MSLKFVKLPDFTALSIERDGTMLGTIREWKGVVELRLDAVIPIEHRQHSKQIKFTFSDPPPDGYLTFDELDEIRKAVDRFKKELEENPELWSPHEKR